MNIVVLTDIPSPYQVELFNSLGRLDGWKLSVIYIRRTAKQRSWITDANSHEHYFMSETGRVELEQRIINCDLAVFGSYRPTSVGRLIRLRNRFGKAWAVWGERPGFHLRGWLGRQARAWTLRELRTSQAPVWGVGKWGVDGFRSELGDRHPFFNVPYASNLGPFLAIERRFERTAGCRFLFSGSFIHRKGVDLVVSAFARLHGEGIPCELHLVGTGPLIKAVKARCVSFSDRVHIYGFRQLPELAFAYANTDVLCAPSRYDGWGLAVVEGLAAAMPVISTDSTGAARELIRPGNGWIVPPDDEDALYGAMKVAATLDTDRQRSMSADARRIAMRQDLKAGVERFARAALLTIDAWRDKNRAT